MGNVMLSTIILACDRRVPALSSHECVARTLGALVPALVAGVVRDLVVATLSKDTIMRDIADEAGCGAAFSDTPDGILAAGLAAARGDFLLVLRAGYAPGAGFIEQVGDFLNDGGGAALLRIEPDSLLTRLAPNSARVEGIILPRSRVAPGAGDLRTLARGAGPTRTLAARLRPVGRS